MGGVRKQWVMLPLLIVCCCASASAEPRVFPGRYVVTLRRTPSAQFSAPQILAQTDPVPLELKREGVKVDSLLGSGSQAVITRPTVQALRGSGAGSDTEPFDPSDTTCAKLIQAGGVQACSPDFEVRASAVPNDPQYGDLYGMAASTGIDAPRAWDKVTGGNGVVVAIIDTGVDYNHPELSQNMWRNPGEIPGNGKDDDGNGYVDDVFGANVVAGNGNPMDDNMHGTHVAGTIGAAGNNGAGVVGVNWSTQIMALKFLSSDGSGSLTSAIKAIDYMVAMKQRGVNVRVSNNSWGGAGFSQPLGDAIGRARDAGILFIAAAGNEANDNDASPTYPSSFDYDNVVSVAAIDRDGNLAGFSNRGATSVDIAAPGVQILSTGPGNTYRTLSGTSMATPHVTGALALLLASEPGLTDGAAITRLYESGVGLASLTGLVRTGRALNVARMVYGETQPVPAGPSPQPSCHYRIEEIPYAPDTSADGAEVILRADDGAYASVALPFALPFYRDTVSTLYVSPNGLAYTKGLPSGMDYQNLDSAPLNSIAALHSDLVATEEPHAVRAVTFPDRAVVTWHARHYLQPAGGTVIARLVVHSTGVIEQFVEFDSAETEAVVQLHATMGITGGSRESADTYASNSTKIRNGLALRYTSECDESQTPLGVTGISVQQTGAKASSVRTGVPIQVMLTGSGDGAVAVQGLLNGLSCPQVAVATLTRGLGSLSGKLPNTVGGFRTLSFKAGAASETVVIKRPRAKGAARKQFVKGCAKLFSVLR